MVSFHLKFLTILLKSQIFKSSLKMFSNIFGIILKPVFWRIRVYINFMLSLQKLMYCVKNYELASFALVQHDQKGKFLGVTFV